MLLPHVGSGSVHTRRLMGQLVVDNLTSWFSGKGPITPVPETAWPKRLGNAANHTRLSNFECTARLLFDKSAAKGRASEVAPFQEA